MVIALVDTDLKRFVADGNISLISSSDSDINEYIQPAGIDIPLGKKAFLVKHKFIPFRKNISYVVEKVKIEEFDLEKGAIFYKGHTYLVKCGDIKVPKGMIAKISPKSSIGRIDVMVRAICDNIGLYDFVSENNSGELWLEITPQSFNIKVQTGIALTQLRIFELDNNTNNNNTNENKTKIAESSIAETEINDKEFLMDVDGQAIANKTFDNKLILSLSVDENKIIGYEALPVNDVIDLTKTDHDYEHYFKTINARKKDSITLEKDKFYILSTKELIKVPAGYCLEMVPFSHLVGELRVHYAGFFDPGFGIPNGASGVLEIRPHENLVVYDGQPICLMEIYLNKSHPEVLYGQSNNNYQGQQGPKLAKYFK